MFEGVQATGNKMGKRKVENTIRAGTKAQAEEILAEQENLIKKVGGEVTENEDIINNSARSNMVAEVIDSYARTKMDRLRTNVAALMAMREDTIIGANNTKLQQIAADYDLDSSYNNKTKLLEFLKQLEENLNLMRANVYVLVAECPRNKKDFIKLWKRPKLIKMTDDQERRMAPNKACLKLLRNCLARRKVSSEATTTSLWDQVADLFMRYRKRTCLDCDSVEEDLIPRETENCYICRDPLCKKCTESIQQLLQLKSEEEHAETIGAKVLVAVCSACRL